MSSFYFQPEAHASFDPQKMGKATLFRSDHVLIGLNCFLPGQQHQLHSHEGMDKAYVVLRGEGTITVGEERHVAREGDIVIAPSGIPHAVENTGERKLILLAVLAPPPGK